MRDPLATRLIKAIATPMRLHIVRHGQTDWNALQRVQGQLDSQLDETGIAQAIERGRDFRKDQFIAVYSSSSLRTRQTSHHLLEGRTKDIVLLDELREVKLGEWEGQYWQDIEKNDPEMVEAHANASESFNIPGAEKMRETQARGVEAMEKIVNTHLEDPADCEILVVSHGAIMKTILAHYIGVPLTELRYLPSLPNCAHCIIEANTNHRHVKLIAGIATVDTPWQRFLKSD
ncbi:MAG: histidine phosphatase family protein [Granulosicoccus sp.]|nr:histidine phosphatase family protein [Granulosicoccus sp.]